MSEQQKTLSKNTTQIWKGVELRKNECERMGLGERAKT